MNQINTGTMLPTLRMATGTAHAALDESFGSLDLNDREDYQRFLLAHCMGLSPLFDTYRDFVTRELAVHAPDFSSMLEADLSELGTNPMSLPRLSVAEELSPPGIAYVVSGSRLGLAMLRRNGYWGRANGLPSRYMENESGLAVWKALVGWMKDYAASPEEEAHASRAAIVAFDTFSNAFAASAPASVQ